MPLYEYRCTSCAKVFEELRSIDNRDCEIYCTACGFRAIRVISSFSVARGDHVQQAESPLTSDSASGLISVTDCTFRNCGTGISVPNKARLHMTRNRFENVGTPVERRDT